MVRRIRSKDPATTNSKRNKKRDPRVVTAMQILDSTGTQTGLEGAARAVNLSASRLRHLIREELGMPPHRYIKNRRLLHARKLLESTFLSVKEIASAAGFADVSHFVRDFKIQFGETPSETRRKHPGRMAS